MNNENCRRISKSGQYKALKFSHTKNKQIKDIKHLSFGGAGFHFCYYVGVIKALNELDPELYKRVKISGVSSGAMIGIIYLSNIDT